jgi:phosphoribosylformylglycinamidine synthase
VVGGIGLIEDLDKIATLKGAQAGDVLLLVGETHCHLGASLYARVILGLDGPAAGSAPPVDLMLEKRNAALVREVIRAGLVNAVHDISDGGIACAAAEMALAGGVGLGLVINDCVIDVDAPQANLGMFGESCAAYLLSVPASKWGDVQAAAEQAGVRLTAVGGLRSNESVPTLTIWDDDTETAEVICAIPLSTLRAAHEGWLPNYMKGGG